MGQVDSIIGVNWTDGFSPISAHAFVALQLEARPSRYTPECLSHFIGNTEGFFLTLGGSPFNDNHESLKHAKQRYVMVWSERSF